MGGPFEEDPMTLTRVAGKPSVTWWTFDPQKLSTCEFHFQNQDSTVILYHLKRRNKWALRTLYYERGTEILYVAKRQYKASDVFPPALFADDAFKPFTRDATNEPLKLSSTESDVRTETAAEALRRIAKESNTFDQVAVKEANRLIKEASNAAQ